MAPAVAYDEGKPAPVQQTADLWQEPAAAVKKGADRAAQALTPAIPTEKADDPTSLATKAKPSPELFIAAAQVHEQAGRIAQAEQAFQQAFSLSPRYLSTQLAYARFKDRQKQSREALEIYSQAAKDHPNDAAVYNDLGLYYARRSMNREAIASFERATQLQPKKALYRNNLAMLLVDAGQAEAAMPHLMAVYTEADACYKLGYLVQKKGDRALAMQYFARAMQINPMMTEAKAWYEHLRSQPGSQNAADPAGRAPEDVSPSRVAARPTPPRPSATITRVAPSAVRDLPTPPANPPQAPLPGSPVPSSSTGSGPGPSQPDPSPTVRPLPAVPRRLPAAGSPQPPAPSSPALPDPPMPPETSLQVGEKVARLTSAEEPAMLPLPHNTPPAGLPAPSASSDSDEPPMPPPSQLLQSSSAGP